MHCFESALGEIPQDAAYPAARRQVGDRLARGAGAQPASRAHTTVESASVSRGVTVPGVVLPAAIGCAIVPAHAQPRIRIGATLSQIGGYAELGQAQARGYKLCVKNANERGGVLGRPLEVLVQDDRSDPATAVRLYEQLIAQDKVAAQAPIRIGATAAQTGNSALAGRNQLRGYQLCVKHTNAKGGVLNRTVELLAHDDGSDSATAVRLYEKLIEQDKVDLALGVSVENHRPGGQCD